MHSLARRFALALALLAPLLVAVPTADAVKLDKPRAFGAWGVGTYQVSQGAVWTDLTAANFNTQTSGTLAGTDYFVELSIANSHATQTLYVLLRANAAEAVTLATSIAPGATLGLTDLVGGAAGANITTISIQGSGAATTGQIIATFSRGSF